MKSQGCRQGRKMEKRNNYQNTEEKTFRNNFGKFKDKKIVLYGIGRFTATLLPCVTDFKIIGLMDRDNANIGKKIYGVPVLGKEEVREKADLIIINTSSNSWKIIYARIADLGIPVYYLNGQLACEKEDDQTYTENPYWEKTYDKLKNEIDNYEVVSFDIFDTLIMRKIYMPQDLYKIVDMRVKKALGDHINYYEMRMEAEFGNSKKEQLLDDIYCSMNKTWKFSEDVLQQIMEIEIETEKRFLIPRKDMIQLYNEIGKNKEVHLISDMYLPEKIVCDILAENGVHAVASIFISGEEKANKRDGTLWKKYAETVVRGRTAIHIGDNYLSDVEMPEKYGIHGAYIMSGGEMLKNSSLGGMIPKIEDLDESLFMGMIIAEIFNSPFALAESKGKVVFQDFEKMGYCIWGGIIYSFLTWLLEEAKKRTIERFLFFARDGYFLEKDYHYMIELLGQGQYPETCYLAISRRLILITSYEENEGLDRIASHVYNGKFAEYMEDRFNIVIPSDAEHYSEEINLPEDYEKVKPWFMAYENQILNEVRKEKKNYLKYVQNLGINEKDAVVDLWFYGNNQFYLSKTIHKPLMGFYFAYNKSEENICQKTNAMISCFQDEDDLLAERVGLYKLALFVESFLTAPYGMIKAVDENGNFICSKNGMNQILFDVRERMNEGVCRFMKEYMYLMDGTMGSLNEEFVDDFFGQLAEEHMELSKELQKVFYYDNAMFRRREMGIFE